MNWPLRIARRYLFARKSANIIHIITGIAVFGIAVGAAALVLVLSVFNGFEDLITSMYGNFNPQVKATPREGKTFAISSQDLEALRRVPGVAYISQTLEEVAFFEYRDKQDFGIIKGVDEYFDEVTGIDSTVREGNYQVMTQQGRNMAVLGLGMRNKLAVSIENAFEPLSIYLPKRKMTGLPGQQQFRIRRAFPAGTFVIQQDFDNQYVLVSLELARELLGDEQALSALEFRLAPGYTASMVVPTFQKILGPGIEFRDRYAQEEAFMKLMKIEKWMSFAIVGLTLLMVAFNMVGALWMIVLEKRFDISMLKSMGARDDQVRNIFLNEGMLLCLIGTGSGFALALLVYGMQKAFGIISIPGAFSVDAYPISLRAGDFIVVAATVCCIGLLAAVPPALRAQRIPAMMREE
jgi:lipoprotein-releasing system permease protein